MRRGAALLLLLALAACAGEPRRPPRAAAAPGVKIGKPYQVFGVWYTPADDRSYDRTGIASWYGPGFHALATANGEVYNQDDVTAAHKTLPMPSWVEVHNLDNGRRLTVRINDRGPFVEGRIIDLSRRSAQLLGVDRAGLARVRVRRVYPDAETQRRLGPPPVIARVPAAPPAASETTPVIVAAVPPPVVSSIEPPPVTSVSLPPATLPGERHVQVAALADPGRIAWLSGYLAAFGPVSTVPGPNGLTRVRLGPFASDEATAAALAKVRAAGYSDARVIPPSAGTGNAAVPMSR